MGRPKLPDEQVKENVVFRLEEAVIRQVKDVAFALGESPSEFLRRAALSELSFAGARRDCLEDARLFMEENPSVYPDVFRNYVYPNRLASVDVIAMAAARRKGDPVPFSVLDLLETEEPQE